MGVRWRLRRPGNSRARPTASALHARPDLEDASRVPYYLMFDLERTRQRPHAGDAG
jgi:hypothetical protein